jgi:multiple sugar transport system permease protein
VRRFDGTATAQRSSPCGRLPAHPLARALRRQANVLAAPKMSASELGVDKTLTLGSTTGRRTTELSDLQFALLVAVPVVCFLVLVIAYPLGYALWMSFEDIQFFGGYRTDFVGLTNYAEVLKDTAFWHSTVISIRFTVESVVLTLLIGMGLALILNRPMRGRALVRAIVILPWAVSPYAAGIVFQYLAQGQTSLATALSFMFGSPDPVNLITRNWIIEVLAVGNAWNVAPLLAFFLLANMATIPTRLFDLAAIDRMTRWEVFRHVTLPPLRFTLFVFTCITTVFSLRMFDYIYTMSRGGPGDASQVLTYQLYKVSFQDLNLGYGAAMSFYLLALILGSTALLYLVWGRHETL